MEAREDLLVRLKYRGVGPAKSTMRKRINGIHGKRATTVPQQEDRYYEGECRWYLAHAIHALRAEMIASIGAMTIE